MTSNVVVARHRFGQRAQQSIDAFVAELPDMLSNCEFVFMVDEFIRDQPVAEKSVDPLAKIKAAPGCTCHKLDGALVIGRLVEETVGYCKDLASASALQKVGAKRTRSTERPPRPREGEPSCSSGKRKWDRCGSSCHLANFATCKARGNTCTSCGKV